METARLAQQPWERLGLRRRLALHAQLRHAMYRNIDLIIDTVVAEQGRPPFEVITELWPTIELLSFYMRTRPAHLAPGERSSAWFRTADTGFNTDLRRGPGHLALELPLILSFAPIVAALITGNTVVYKPSEYATRIGRSHHRISTRPVSAGSVPGGVRRRRRRRGLIRERPNKICFTGSVATGRKVAAAAGELLIPVVLELGGKDAAIVLEDADLDRTAAGLVWGGMFNAGQACLSIERIYVMRQVAEAACREDGAPDRRSKFAWGRARGGYVDGGHHDGGAV